MVVYVILVKAERTACLPSAPKIKGQLKTRARESELAKPVNLAYLWQREERLIDVYP